MTEIKTALLNSEELRQRIVESIGHSTVALFAISKANGAETLKLAGTGTLVVIDGVHYILTAAHVWEDVLKSANQLGITLTDRINHKTPIDISAIVPTVLKPGASLWNEWGADLALLRIPRVLVGSISARLVFEDIKAPPKHLNAEALECWVAMGTPAELGTFAPHHAAVQINGRFLLDPPLSHTRKEYDYFEFQMDITEPGVPKSFGGFSGGGLWRVMLYSSRDTGEIDWAQRLKGVIFWQFHPVNGSRKVRAHGPNSVLEIAKATNPVVSLI